MNHKYFLNYICRHLHTIVRQYNPQGEILEVFRPATQLADKFSNDRVCRLFFSEQRDMPSEPQILTVDHRYTYAFVPAGEYSCIVGPVQIYHTEGRAKQYSAAENKWEWPGQVPSYDYRTFEEDILLIYNLYREKPVSIGDIQLWKNAEETADDKVKKNFFGKVFYNRESGKKHNPYDQELRVMTSIENGDIELLKKSMQEDYEGEIGTLAKDALRHAKNLGVVILTLSSRAAIRGGVLPEIAYSLCDSYVLQIEDSRDVASVIQLFRSAEFEYAKMVEDIKGDGLETGGETVNLQVVKCKAYISAHIHERITVQDIAEKLGLNPSYLSALFRKYENQSITEYIRREKINLAKEFLIYSEYSYSEIATYLGYSSQSHLGKYFKEAVNMTMRQYREKYGVKD